MAYESERSTSELVRGALDDMRELIREEVLLAKAEMRQEASKLASAGLQFGMAGGALYFAALFVLVAVSLGLAALLNWPAWSGFALMALILGAGGVVLLSSARRALRTVEPLPRTVNSIKETLR